MTNGAFADISVRPIAADPSEIIQPRRSLVVRDVQITLDPTVVTPIDPTTPVTPFIPFVPPTTPDFPDKVSLIINIETTGLSPFKHKIIAIGIQDPLKPDLQPTILIDPNESVILNQLFDIIKDGMFTEFIGYGQSFDFRFILIRAMKFGITCKEFFRMDLYDTMQAMAQGKFEFMYYAQKPVKLSDVGDFFWGFPKPFTDLEMIKHYHNGRLDKVIEFASSQVTRILAVYLNYRHITELEHTSTASGAPTFNSVNSSGNTPPTESSLTIPEANPNFTLRKCEECLAESQQPIGQVLTECPICKEPFGA